ncbi:MAG: saccharopine dehydrogenase NADP-binding domain-containing protein [Candidatus Saccharibacteria bacterium]|nr:saccharopine dehydrogenase NADP-binding domain-containing protein [Moraxellaceae bacterium]
MSNYQLIVFGATSFVGQLLTRYLFERHGVNGDLSWAIAGRSETKLKEVRALLGEKGATLPILLANADDESSLLALCQQTRVIVSTVGPYSLYGSPLVKVCAESGTDYCDLTGEAPWIGKMLAAHEETAKRTGARIVNCSGFDSIPSDLGTYFLQQKSKEQFGQYCTRVKMRVKAMRGGLSGGTVASIINIIHDASKDPSIRKMLMDPYSLCPPTQIKRPYQPNINFASFDPDANAWTFPFIMASINTKIVQRSHALSDYAYGTDFIYDEAMLAGSGLKGRATAIGAALGIAGAFTALVIPPTRALMARFVVPKPGEGPTPKQQAKGFYDIRFIGQTKTGETLTVKVTGDRDPGYGSTCKILGEAAVCLALDVTKEEKPGGFWTPSTLMGNRLIKRLNQYAGLSFTVISHC